MSFILEWNIMKYQTTHSTVSSFSKKLRSLCQSLTDSISNPGRGLQIENSFTSLSKFPFVNSKEL